MRANSSLHLRRSAGRSRIHTPSSPREMAGEAGMNRGRCRGGDKGQTVKEKIGRTAPSDVVGPQVSVLLAMKKNL